MFEEEIGEETPPPNEHRAICVHENAQKCESSMGNGVHTQVDNVTHLGTVISFLLHRLLNLSSGPIAKWPCCKILDYSWDNP